MSILQGTKPLVKGSVKQENSKSDTNIEEGELSACFSQSEETKENTKTQNKETTIERMLQQFVRLPKK